MKEKDRVKFIVYPAVLCIVCIACAIGLVFYYQSKANSTIISYVMCAILGGVGIACGVSTIIQLVHMVNYKSTQTKGIPAQAEFVSYETKSSVDKQAIYRITIKYNADGKETTYITPSEFTWQEVLALKCAKEFNVKYYKNNCILLTNVEELILRYSKEIAEEQKKYDEAFNKVQNVLSQKVEGIAERKVTSVEKKKTKDEIKESERPDAGDGI